MEERARLRLIGIIVVIVTMIGFITMGTFGTSNSLISEIIYVVLGFSLLIGATIIYKSYQEPREPAE